MDQLLQRIKPSDCSSYAEFMQALLIEALSNTDMTFDEVNYKLYALNRTIFNELSQRSIVFLQILGSNICVSRDMNMFRQ